MGDTEAERIRNIVIFLLSNKDYFVHSNKVHDYADIHDNMDILEDMIVTIIELLEEKNILTFFEWKERMAIADIFTVLAILISIISIGISLYTHKRNEDLPLIKDHFQDLKTSVIEPLIYILRNIPDQLPNFDELNKGTITIYENYSTHSDDPQKDQPLDSHQLPIDRILIKDLIDNHYPIIKNLWNETFTFYIDKVCYHQVLKTKLKQIFETEFKEKGLNLLEFKILRIIEYLLLEKEFTSTSLTVNTYHHNKSTIHLGVWSHREIYEEKDPDTTNSVKNSLDQIIQKALQLDDLKEQLCIYRFKCNSYEKKLDGLESLLTTLKYKKKLNFEKDDINNNLCKIIDSKI